ncbi:MAG: N-formylglutamate deformylase [Woeseiaceae bacterium]|nr:N-formylglutamate deformylase [Woeseiaceae bacterium]
MSDVYDFHAGESPLLISVPHDGRQLPPGIAAQMTETALSLPDTDWHVARLYDFARDLGASLLVARYSRYVVDLNRPADDAALYPGQLATGLCPRQTFDGRDLYDGEVTIDSAARVERFWRPYHARLRDSLEELRQAHGRALLWDAHSIASHVPALFDGELPVLNIGTFGGRSCDERIAAAVLRAAEASPYDVVRDARFKGGYITRHYGNPAGQVHAVQLELAQRAYMNEQTREYDPTKASQLADTLRALLAGFTMPA